MSWPSSFSPRCAARLRATAPSSLSKASAKSCTPSSTSFAVTASIEMPDRSSAAIVCLASSIFSSRLAPHLPVIAERIHGRRRHGVDRVGGDQLLDIEHVAVVRVLRAGAGPKQPLHPRALGTQLLPARAGEKPLVALIGKLGVGDRDLAAQPGERTALIGLVRLGQGAPR